MKCHQYWPNEGEIFSMDVFQLGYNMDIVPPVSITPELTTRHFRLTLLSVKFVFAICFEFSHVFFFFLFRLVKLEILFNINTQHGLIMDYLPQQMVF